MRVHKQDSGSQKGPDGRKGLKNVGNERIMRVQIIMD